MIEMDFTSDISKATKKHFAENGVTYDASAGASRLVRLYFETRERLIEPHRRAVFISEETHDSLGELSRETRTGRRDAAHDAWRATFRIENTLRDGGDVVPHLSRNVKNADYSDGLLWDYAMHHFHLSTKVDSDGFVERSDYLLFAIVSEDAAYLVDIVKHDDPQGDAKNLKWVRHRLLETVAANFPELLDPVTIHNVTPSERITDEQKKELRRKNASIIVDVGGKMIGPLGGGMTADGHSVFYLMKAGWFMRLIEDIEELLSRESEAVLSSCEKAGIDTTNGVRLKLARLRDLDYTNELIEKLKSAENAFGSLARHGYAITDGSTSIPLL